MIVDQSIQIGLTALLGAAGWGLWFLACQDAKAARRQAQEAVSRARLAELQAASMAAGRAIALATAGAAEAQVRVAATECHALRRALADAATRRGVADDRKPDDLLDSTTKRMMGYPPRHGDE